MKNDIIKVEYRELGIEEAKRGILKDIKPDYDLFKLTPAYSFLKNSERINRKFPSFKDIWRDPDDFLKELRDYIIDRTELYNMDFWILHWGYEGSAKSSTSIMLYTELSKYYNIRDYIHKLQVENLIFSQTEYSKRVYDRSVYEDNDERTAIVIDDAHYVFGKYMGMTTETWAVLQLARFVRDMQIVHILNTQTPQQLIQDIWRERINSCVYHFFIDVTAGGKVIDRLFFVAFYNVDDYQDLTDFPKLTRKPLAWKKILTKVPPSFITIIGPYMFPKYDEEYKAYKFVKKLYKELYSYLRYKKLMKGNYFDIVFTIISLIAKYYEDTDNLYEFLNQFIQTLPKRTLAKLAEAGILVIENKQVKKIHPDIIRFGLNYRDVILQRYWLITDVMKLLDFEEVPYTTLGKVSEIPKKI